MQVTWMQKIGSKISKYRFLDVSSHFTISWFISKASLRKSEIENTTKLKMCSSIICQWRKRVFVWQYVTTDNIFDWEKQLFIIIMNIFASLTSCKLLCIFDKNCKSDIIELPLFLRLDVYHLLITVFCRVFFREIWWFSGIIL